MFNGNRFFSFKYCSVYPFRCQSKPIESVNYNNIYYHISIRLVVTEVPLSLHLVQLNTQVS